MPLLTRKTNTETEKHEHENKQTDTHFGTSRTTYIHNMHSKDFPSHTRAHTHTHSQNLSPLHSRGFGHDTKQPQRSSLASALDFKLTSPFLIDVQ